MAETPLGKAVAKFLDCVETAAVVAKEIITTGKELVDLIKEDRKGSSGDEKTSENPQ